MGGAFGEGRLVVFAFLLGGIGVRGMASVLAHGTVFSKLRGHRAGRNKAGVDEKNREQTVNAPRAALQVGGD